MSRLTIVRASASSTRRLLSSRRPARAASTRATEPASSTARKLRSGLAAARSMMKSPRPAPSSTSSGALRSKSAARSSMKAAASVATITCSAAARASRLRQTRAALRNRAIVRCFRKSPAPVRAGAERRTARRPAPAGHIGRLIRALQKRVDALHQRLQIRVVDQRARHLHRIAEEKSLVQQLASRKRAARRIPGQAIERNALARLNVRAGQVAIDLSANRTVEIGFRRNRHHARRAVELDDLDHPGIELWEEIARDVERRPRRREHPPAIG